MAIGVAKALLHDAEDRVLQGAGELLGLAVYPQFDR